MKRLEEAPLPPPGGGVVWLVGWVLAISGGVLLLAGGWLIWKTPLPEGDSPAEISMAMLIAEEQALRAEEAEMASRRQGLGPKTGGIVMDVAARNDPAYLVLLREKEHWQEATSQAGIQLSPEAAQGGVKGWLVSREDPLPQAAQELLRKHRLILKAIVEAHPQRVHRVHWLEAPSGETPLHGHRLLLELSGETASARRFVNAVSQTAGNVRLMTFHADAANALDGAGVPRSEGITIRMVLVFQGKDETT